MSKNNDSFNLFDFNGNGKIDPVDTFILYNIINEIEHEEDDIDDDDCFLNEEAYDTDDSFPHNRYIQRTEEEFKKADDLLNEYSQKDTKTDPVHFAHDYSTLKVSRASSIKITLVVIAVCVALGIIPVLLIQAAAEMDNSLKDGAAGVYIVVVICILFLCFLAYIICRMLYTAVTEYRKEKQDWLKNATEEDLGKYHRDKKRNRVILIICLAAAAVIIVFALTHTNHDSPAKTSKSKTAAVTAVPVTKPSVTASPEPEPSVNASPEPESSAAASPEPEREYVTADNPPREGMYIFEEQKLTWVRYGPEKTKSGVQATKYAYVTEKYAFAVWVDDDDMICQARVTYYDKSEQKKPDGKNYYSEDLPVDEYVHPDDFYERYIDDFWDYEEAEEYYYEHGGF